MLLGRSQRVRWKTPILQGPWHPSSLDLAPLLCRFWSLFSKKSLVAPVQLSLTREPQSCASALSHALFALSVHGQDKKPASSRAQKTHIASLPSLLPGLKHIRAHPAQLWAVLHDDGLEQSPNAVYAGLQRTGDRAKSGNLTAAVLPYRGAQLLTCDPTPSVRFAAAQIQAGTILARPTSLCQTNSTRYVPSDRGTGLPLMHHEIRNVRPSGLFWASSIGLRSGLRASTSLVQASLRVLKLFGLVHFEHQEISLFD